MCLYVFIVKKNEPPCAPLCRGFGLIGTVNAVFALNLQPIATEVHNQTIVYASGRQIVYQLHLMNWQYGIHCFQLNNQASLNHNVGAVVAHAVPLVVDGDWIFHFAPQPMVTQFASQSVAVHYLQISRQ